MKKLYICILICVLCLSACGKNPDMTKVISDWIRNTNEVKCQILKDNNKWEQKVITSKEDKEPILLYLGTGGYRRVKHVQKLESPRVKLNFDEHKFEFQENYVSVDGTIYDTENNSMTDSMLEIYSMLSR